MSKGSNRRPGTGYAENWDRIFGRKELPDDFDPYKANGAAKAMNGKPYAVLHTIKERECAEPFCSCEEGKCIVGEKQEAK